MQKTSANIREEDQTLESESTWCCINTLRDDG